ncbi:ABC transporter substrate-binding protein [Terrarubrum flagellatum]|uniref:ABC transporter substrate-binding protein n=1 Tax=Terrirubrum flagellatum TaxID=2895980 RepID=UPI0031457057
MRKLIPFAAALLSAAAIVSARAAEKTLVVAASVFPQSLQTGQSSFASLSLLEQTNESLVGRDNAGALHPGLAEKWEAVNDTTWRFHLRKGVKWHDGKPFTAADVVFTINRIVDPQVGYGLLARIGQVSGATVVDDYTVDVKTKVVFPTLVRGMSDIIIEPKHYYEQVGAQGVIKKPLGTGPFIFQSYTPGDRYELKANPDYWGGAPKFDKLVIREIPEAATRVASLLAGETQIIEEVPIDLIDQVNTSGRAKIDEIPTSAGLILTYDVRKPPFDNPKVREALDYAIDKPTILKEILKGHGELLQGQLLTSSALGFDPSLKARPFDPAKARKMLQEAGYNFSTQVPITTQSGKYVSDVDMCNVIAGMLNEVGVKATVNVVEGGVYSKISIANELGPLSMVAWYNLGDADFASVWFTKGGKRTVWVNDDYEKFFAMGRSTNDEAERVKAYHQMSGVMFEENPAIFLFGLPSVYAASTKIAGFGAASDKVLRLSKVELK